MDVSNLLCLSVVRSFWSSICVVFLSYWRDLSRRVVLDLMSGSFFVCRFCFVIIWWVVRDLLYRRLSWVWEPCHTLSLFFWRPVLFCLSFLFCIIWWVWEICHTVEYDGCERPVIPCRSFSYVESLLFFFILCAGLSAFIPSYYLQSRFWIYLYLYLYV